MPTRPTKRPAFREGAEVHKKARVERGEKTKPVRRGTPPPKPRSKPAGRDVAFSEKTKITVAPLREKDVKGKGKAKVSALSKKADVSSVSSLPHTFKVVVGSYEKLLYGLEGTVSVEDGSRKFALKPIFIFPAHISSLKAIAASPQGGKWLATGSADEIVKVWDLRRKKEIGGLMHHEGSITHLEFPSRSHLLSASEDGTLCLFRARDWAVLRSLKGHKGRVNSVAVHPSGKVALSVGKDRTLRMWDLMRGTGSASTKLGKEAELVRWTSTGNLFVVQTQFTLDIYSTDMTLLHTLIHPSRIQDVKFAKRVDDDRELMLIAAEDKKVTVYQMDVDTEKMPSVIAVMVGATNRVKAVDTLKIALPPVPNSERKSTTIVAAISSDGKVRVYDLADVPSVAEETAKELTAIAEYDSKGSRLTCMALADGETPALGKRKRAEVDEHEADEEGDSDDGAEEWAGAQDESQSDENEHEVEAEAEEEGEDD